MRPVDLVMLVAFFAFFGFFGFFAFFAAGREAFRAGPVLFAAERADERLAGAPERFRDVAFPEDLTPAFAVLFAAGRDRFTDFDFPDFAVFPVFPAFPVFPDDLRAFAPDAFRAFAALADFAGLRDFMDFTDSTDFLFALFFFDIRGLYLSQSACRAGGAGRRPGQNVRTRERSPPPARARTAKVRAR